MRKLTVALLLGGSLALEGCIPLMAAGAVGSAVRAGTEQGPPAYDPVLRATAMEACRVQGASFGTVNVIDAESRRGGAIRVYGTVEGPPERRSFQCDYSAAGRITRFETRPIRPR